MHTPGIIPSGISPLSEPSPLVPSTAHELFSYFTKAHKINDLQLKKYIHLYFFRYINTNATCFIKKYVFFIYKHSVLISYKNLLFHSHALSHIYIHLLHGRTKNLYKMQVRIFRHSVKCNKLGVGLV